jgi:hypothetical protein
MIKNYLTESGPPVFSRTSANDDVKTAQVRGTELAGVSRYYYSTWSRTEEIGENPQTPELVLWPRIVRPSEYGVLGGDEATEII